MIKVEAINCAKFDEQCELARAEYQPRLTVLMTDPFK